MKRVYLPFGCDPGAWSPDRFPCRSDSHRDDRGLAADLDPSFVAADSSCRAAVAAVGAVAAARFACAPAHFVAYYSYRAAYCSCLVAYYSCHAACCSRLVAYYSCPVACYSAADGCDFAPHFVRYLIGKR